MTTRDLASPEGLTFLHIEDYRVLNMAGLTCSYGTETFPCTNIGQSSTTGVNI